MCLRPFCISFNIFFALFAENMSMRKTWKNYAEIAEVTTYGAIDGLSSPRRSADGHNRMKNMLLKEDRGNITKCGDTQDPDGPSTT